MTTNQMPEEIAREIVKNIYPFDRVPPEWVNIIAQALREFGEAECKRVLARNDEWYHKLLDDARKDSIKADSEGYRRGVEWAMEVANKYADGTGSAIYEELQRGTGGEE